MFTKSQDWYDLVYDAQGTLRQLPSAPPTLALWLWPATSRQTIRDGGRLGITYNQSQPTTHSNAGPTAMML